MCNFTSARRNAPARHAKSLRLLTHNRGGWKFSMHAKLLDDPEFCTFMELHGNNDT
jgi:hypothetical protein